MDGLHEVRCHHVEHGSPLRYLDRDASSENTPEQRPVPDPGGDDGLCDHGCGCARSDAGQEPDRIRIAQVLRVGDDRAVTVEQRGTPGDPIHALKSGYVIPLLILSLGRPLLRARRDAERG